MRYIWRLVLISAGVNLIGILHAFVYGWLTGFPGLSGSDLCLLFSWADISFILAYVIVPLAYYFCYRSIDKAIPSQIGNNRIEADVLTDARRKTLNMPVGFTRITVGIWVIAGLSFIPVYILFRPGQWLLPAIHIAVVTILVGGIAGAFTFYVAEWYTRRYLIPVLFPEGQLSSIKGVFAPSPELKILFLVVDACALPIGVLSITALLGAATPSVIFYIGISFLIIGLLQGLAIKKSLNMPIYEVVREMSKVRDGDMTAMAQVLSVDQTGILTEGFNEMVEGLRRGEMIRESFGRYVSKDVLDRLLQGKIDLSGEVREATVLFCDIRGFTAISEHLPPKELLASLNGWLDIMVDAVVDHGGRVDKFIGDSIMAVFGVPIAQKNHAMRAVRTGLDMLERLEHWNTELAKPDFTPWKIGIGIHSGEVIAGNIGSTKKMEYAVIGDVVNTASRIEQLNKAHKTSILISHQTYDLVKQDVQAECIGRQVIRGKIDEIALYRLDCITSD